MSEVAMYYQIATTDYPDMVKNGVQLYGHSLKAELCAAECAYIRLHQRLPEWGEIVEAFEIVNGSYIFIHHDPTLDD